MGGVDAETPEKIVGLESPEPTVMKQEWPCRCIQSFTVRATLTYIRRGGKASETMLAGNGLGGPARATRSRLNRTRGVLAGDFAELKSARARVGPESGITIAEEDETCGIGAESRYGRVRKAHNGRVSCP